MFGLNQFDEGFDMENMMLNYYNLDLSYLFLFGFFHIWNNCLIHLYLDLLFMGFLGVYKSFDFY